MRAREKRRLRQEQHNTVAQYPTKLMPVPKEEWPQFGQRQPVDIWRSRDYMVQLWQTPGGLRMSVCRVKIGKNGRWEDGLTWDELQSIKSEIGFGDWYGVEVYPRDSDVVNDANFRHIWMFAKPLNIGWFPKEG